MWAPILQYGAVGVILAIFLALFVRIFRRLIDNLLLQNQQLWEIQKEQLTALQGLQKSNEHIESGISNMLHAIRQLDTDMSMAFNSSDLTGRRVRLPNDAPRTRIPTQPETPTAKGRGGGSGNNNGGGGGSKT